MTVYCFGDPAKMSDPNSKLALRIHDEVSALKIIAGVTQSNDFGSVMEAMSSVRTSARADLTSSSVSRRPSKRLRMAAAE